MNYSRMWNLNPQATNYVADVMGEEPLGPSPDIEATSPADYATRFVEREMVPQTPAPVAPAPVDSGEYPPDVRAAYGMPQAGGEAPGAAASRPDKGSVFPDYRENIEASEVEPATARGSYVAPHWQGSGRSETVQKGLDPSLLEPGKFAGLQGSANRIQAADASYEADRMQSDVDKRLATAAVMADEHARAVRDDVARRRAAYVDTEMQKLSALSQEAEKKVNPDQYWDDNGGTGARIFAALAVALGQFGASLTGGSNTAMQIIQSNIDRNIKAQQANIDNAGQTLARRRSLYAQNLEALGDPNQAYLATKAQYLDRVKTQLGEQYASIGAKRNEAAYHDMLGKINDEQGKIYNDYAKLAGDKLTLQSTERFVPGGMAGAGGVKERNALYVPTLGGYARDAETARKLNEQGAQRMQINASLREIHDLLDESKGLSSVTDYGRMQEIRSQIASLKNSVLQKSTVLAGQGAMSEGDKAVAEIASSLGDVDPRGASNASIERMKRGLMKVATMHMRDHKLAGQGAGIQLGEEKYRMGPSGPEPVSELRGVTKAVTKKTESYEDDRLPVKGVAR